MLKYTIQRGDTFGKLAKKYYQAEKWWPTFQKLYDYDPNNLPVGVTIEFPEKPTDSDPGEDS